MTKFEITALETLDSLTNELTAFVSFAEMLNA